MPDVSNGDVVRVTANMSYQGASDIINVFHCVAELTVDVDDAVFMGDVGAEVDANYALIVQDLTDDLKFENIEFYNVTDDRPMGVITWPTLTVGLETTSQPVATQMCGQVNFLTGVKRSQGRKYIGGYSELANTGGGFLQVGVQGRLENYGAQFAQGQTITGGTIYWGHYKTGTTIFRQWTGYIVPSLMSTQRRRKQNVGS